jgi:tRNA/tmRNA/rRNA uracil-C5-methylase (TrmA/RlmC/RlmD family)
MTDQAIGTAGDVEIDLHGLTHGGSAVGRLPDGTACFVDYAIPGERVRVRVTDRRKRWARAELLEVITPSPDRVDPPCPLFGPGRCGGCKLQHISPARQAQLLAGVIGDQLRRIGHLDVEDPSEMVRPHRGNGLGYRNRARFAVDRTGHLAFRRAGSHDLIPVDDCPLLTAAGRETLRNTATGWRGARAVRMQVGTDERAVFAVTPGRGDIALPGDAAAVVTGPRRQRSERGDPHAAFTVAGRTFHVHATSFFQASAAAAEHLVALVRRRTAVTEGDHVLELYAGVGLLAAALADDGARVTAVESQAQACRDAERNTAGLDVTIVHAPAGRGVAVAGAVDAVVLDPPRQGADPEVIEWIAELSASRVTYVSCDPATFARDARMLVDRGYRLAEVVGVDQFTHTAHVELVGAFQRNTV